MGSKLSSGKKISVRRQCELSLKALLGIFDASRYVGPRPDRALRAVIRAVQAQYSPARPEVRREFEMSLLACTSYNRIKSRSVADRAIDRERCWLICDEERKGLSSVLVRLYRKQPGESVHEWMESAKTFRKAIMDETTLAAITAELEGLLEPLPKRSKKDRR